MLTPKKVRRSIATALRQLTTHKLLIPLTLIALYVAGLLAAGWKAGFWTPHFATDTAFWFVGSALVLFSKLNAASDPGFFRRTALATVELTASVEFAPLWSGTAGFEPTTSASRKVSGRFSAY